MAGSDKLSSPSSSSNYSHLGSSVTSGRTITQSNDEPYLVIKRHPPTSVYSNESFKVEVQLELPKTSSPPSTIWNVDEAIHLKATLCHARSGKPVRDGADLMTTPMRITIPGAMNADNSSSSTNECTNETDNNNNTTRSVTVECMIRTDSIRRDSESGYVVKFSTSGEDRSNNNPMNSPGRARVVNGVSTRPTQLVSYKIRATVEDGWDNVWYKDEGGRDKSMEVFVAIYDKDGQLKTGENIPLNPILCYKVDKGERESVVANQDILRTLGSSNIVLDKDTGKTRLRFRVEDVSKNHQGQDFILKIAPDTRSKRYKDIAPAYTPAVNVRSKRNKRSRGVSTRQSSGKSGNENVGRSSDSPPGVRQRLTGSFGGGGQESLRTGPGSQNVSLNPADANRLQQAMRGIIGWADEVVNGLYPLQWQVLGYQQHPDGTPDYTRPYHNMPNPNGPISRILSAYTDQVRGHLRILLNAVEEAQASSINSGGAGVSNAGDFMSSTTLQGRDFQSGDIYGTLLGHNRFGVQGTAALGTMGSDPVMRVPGDAGLSPAVMGGTSGLHPSLSADGLRVRSDAGNTLPYSSRTNIANPTALPGLPGPSTYGIHVQNTMSAAGMPQQQGLRNTNLEPQQRVLGNDSHESEVEYVLAKQYKTLRNGTRLGFPAFSASKEILGFFREGNGKVGVGQFVPISHHSDDFGPLEILQASEILEDFIAKKSDAVHYLKDHASITSLLDAALVYDWSKDINNGPNAQVNQN
eukprot:CAMPEP_0197180000 /NCGR_PEP_ID=MMETSP1423-20130617/4770_1 /TAXON_ID=476441 /ORGANISM="Pseudo-nitzschia heimii, Strain UNC1101" /LENGTH=749 /DNA_ID=CAMNT_0042630015 /DNA_START=253 /DNA_END=2502 /DNA_ORIENTATION=+